MTQESTRPDTTPAVEPDSLTDPAALKYSIDAAAVDYALAYGEYLIATVRAKNNDERAECRDAMTDRYRRLLRLTGALAELAARGGESR